ncbi:MAG: hypothetical protein JW884_07350 [Deltaproteobacteria bacterium]|nr:hypothetical protein [Deltaproteobacteria bacterium]
MAVSPTGGGGVKIDDIVRSSVQVTDNTYHAFKAEPAAGYIFSHWSGDLAGSENPQTILVTCDKYITAHFEASQTTYEYYIPYYRAEDPSSAADGFYSSLALRNSSAGSAATVTVAAYESDGTAVPLAAEFTDFSISPSGQWARVLPQIDVEGWVLVTSTAPLTGLAWVGTLDESWPRLMADVSLIGELNSALIVPHVAQTISGCYTDGGWSTKVNICNPHATTTTVTLAYYTTSGANPHATTFSIPANGSVSYNLDSLLPTTQCFYDGSMAISATQAVAAFALYYDVDKVPGADGTCYAGISAVGLQ